MPTPGFTTETDLQAGVVTAFLPLRAVCRTGNSHDGGTVRWSVTASGIHVWACGIQVNQQTITANYTALVTDHTILLDCTDAAIIVTLPEPGESMDGLEFFLKKIDSTSNAGTVTPNASTSFIDGSASYSLATQYKGVKVAWNRADKVWYITGEVA